MPGKERKGPRQARPSQPKAHQALAVLAFLARCPLCSSRTVAAARKEQGPETEAAQASMGQGSPSVATEGQHAGRY